MAGTDALEQSILEIFIACATRMLASPVDTGNNELSSGDGLIELMDDGGN